MMVYYSRQLKTCPLGNMSILNITTLSIVIFSIVILKKNR